MDLSDLYAISDLILQKLNQTQDDSRSGDIERHLLLPYTKHLSELQNIKLIQSYANEVFGGVLITTTLKTINELNKKEPDLDKIRKMLIPIEEFIKTNIGYDEKEIDRRVNSSKESIEKDLKTLVTDMKNWIKEMPQVATANEVPDEIKDGLNELKEQFMKMKKENDNWKH